jgi:phosphohistidine phosphatase
MNLFLLRHAKAAELEEAQVNHDRDRPLTEEGKAKMRLVAQGMKALELAFDAILTSPCLRAKQTAEITAKALGLESRVEGCPPLAPAGDPAQLVEIIRTRHNKAHSILLVGHEPNLSELVSKLTTGNLHLALDFKKASLVKLSVSVLKPGRCAVLDWFLAPGQLALLAGASPRKEA